MPSSRYTAVVLVAMVFAAPVWSQSRSGPNWPTPPPSAEHMPHANKPRNPDLQQLQRAAEQQKAQVRKDADRLRQLVDELKQELDKTPAGTLSVDAVNKSKEIEKLAKHVRKEIQGD